MILARFIYSTNQFSVPAVFSLIALDLGSGISGLGVITSGFYAGVALFQVPGGILAAKIGPKKTLMIGTLLYSLASLLIGLSTAISQIAILRFAVGVGMALVFPSQAALVSKHFRLGEAGLGIGLLIAAYAIGGATGLLAWAVVSEFTGWRLSMIGGGVLGLGSGMLMLALIPKDSIRTEFRIKASVLRQLLLDKWTITLTLVLLGLTVGTTLVGNFIVYYLEDSLKLSAGLAGSVASLTLLCGLITSPLLGRMYDREKNVNRLSLLTLGLVALGVAALAVGTLPSAILAAAFVGLGSGGGWTVLFAAVRDANRGESEYEPVVIGWANSLSSVTFWAPILFSFIVASSGYTMGWLFGGLATFLWIIPFAVTRRH